MEKLKEQEEMKGQGTGYFGLVQKLIEQSETEYHPPKLPFDPFPKCLDDWKNGTTPLPAFGEEIKRQWSLASDVAFLNHGSYGCAPRLVAKMQRQWQKHAEEQPCLFFNSELFPLLVWSIRYLASFIGADPRDLVLVHNATTGMNAVIQSFPFKAGDAALCLKYTYGAIKNTLQYTLTPKGVSIVDVNMAHPFSAERVIAQVKEALEQDKEHKIKLAVFDHIISALSGTLPIPELIELCHQHGVQVLVDGAHCIGQIPLDLNSLGADYYVSNCHKWLCTPRGTAFLWVDRKHHATVRPPVMSHGYNQGLHSEFVWQATDDYSSFLSLPTSIEFFKAIGPERIMEHNNKLVKWAAEMLAERWKTEILVPLSDCRSMALIRVPSHPLLPVSSNGAEWLHDVLWNDYKIEAMVYPNKDLGSLVTRISAHMYNTESDYVRYADALLKVLGLEASEGQKEK